MSRNLRIVLAVMLSLVLVLSVAACGGSDSATSDGVGGYYSDADLSGAWFFFFDGETPLYMIFDGAGSVTDVGAFNQTLPATYSVATSGAISLTLDNMGGAWSGKLTSATTGTMSLPMTGTMEKVADPSICAGNWSGIIDETNPGTTTHSVSLTVDSTGDVTSFASATISGPVTGKLFCYSSAASTAVAGFLRTGEVGAMGQIQIHSLFDGNNTIDGQFDNDSGAGFDGFVTISR